MNPIQRSAKKNTRVRHTTRQHLCACAGARVRGCDSVHTYVQGWIEEQSQPWQEQCSCSDLPRQPIVSSGVGCSSRPGCITCLEELLPACPQTQTPNVEGVTPRPSSPTRQPRRNKPEARTLAGGSLAAAPNPCHAQACSTTARIARQKTDSAPLIIDEDATPAEDSALPFSCTCGRQAGGGGHQPCG